MTVQTTRRASSMDRDAVKAPQRSTPAGPPGAPPKGGKKAKKAKKEKVVHNVSISTPWRQTSDERLTDFFKAELYAAVQEANINPYSKESFKLYC
jgi:hypothetical protein